MRGIYVDDRLARWRDSGALSSWIRRAADHDVTTLIMAAEKVTPELRRLCRSANLEILASVSCFSGWEVEDRPELAPRTATGPLRRESGRPGLIPTDSAYNEELVDSCVRTVADHDIDGVVLDFIRWPLHWEMVLRPGQPPAEIASYDRTSLAAFQDRTGVRLSADDPVGDVRDHHWDRWIDWRCQVITDVTQVIVDAMRKRRPDVSVGAFLVPARDDEERRRLVGQSVTDLGSVVDAFLPMTYHALLERPVEWITEVTADVVAHTSRPVIPMVEAPGAGADELHRAVSMAGDEWCVYPGSGVGDEQWAALARTDG